VGEKCDQGMGVSYEKVDDKLVM